MNTMTNTTAKPACYKDKKDLWAFVKTFLVLIGITLIILPLIGEHGHKPTMHVLSIEEVPYKFEANNVRATNKSVVFDSYILPLGYKVLAVKDGKEYNVKRKGNIYEWEVLGLTSLEDVVFYAKIEGEQE